MLNQVTILKTLLFSSGMASQGETWPFQEGLVRAHWQNVRPLQMSQWHQSGRPNQHARHTSWRSWTHLIRFRLGRKPSNRQPRGCQPGTHCGDFSKSCPARYAAVMHYNYQNPMHWLTFPLVIFDKATRDSRGNIPIPTFPQKRDWLGHISKFIEQNSFVQVVIILIKKTTDKKCIFSG